MLNITKIIFLYLINIFIKKVVNFNIILRHLQLRITR